MQNRRRFNYYVDFFSSTLARDTVIVVPENAEKTFRNTRKISKSLEKIGRNQKIWKKSKNLKQNGRNRKGSKKFGKN